MIDINIEFERECFKCSGTSAWMLDKSCEICGSTGRISTELGDKLLEFLEHNAIKPTPVTTKREE